MAKTLHVLRHFIDTLYYYNILHCAVAMMYVTIFLMEIDYFTIRVIVMTTGS